MKSPTEEGVDPTGLSSDFNLFSSFSYNNNNPQTKKITMIPVKYKLKEERRKVLKISVSKLKKIDDPESWLCRSVLINNTMKKLQRETREEKINKHINNMPCSKSFDPKTSENNEFDCQLNNNSIDNDKNDSSDSSSLSGKEYDDNSNDESSCFFQKELDGDTFFKLNDEKTNDFLLSAEVGREVDRAIEKEVQSAEKVALSQDESDEDKLTASISEGVSLNEDFVDKIPSIKRCASRKKSVDEDGTADEILNLNSDLAMNCETSKRPEIADEVDENDVHDVLSQLYLPPTPRVLSGMESTIDNDDLNVVDIDSSYIDNIKTDCPKLPDVEFFDDALIGSQKKEREDDDEDDSNPAKRRKLEDIFSCFNVCDDNYDNFLCNTKTNENASTSAEEENKDSTENQNETQTEPPTEPQQTETENPTETENQNGDDEVIELEDEEDIKRRLSQSLSSHYHRKPEKVCENFFEDNCDNQYSCGHTVTMFNDLQSVTFHNLIASLET